MIKFFVVQLLCFMLFFFWNVNLHVSKQYAAHSHMIVKPYPLLGGFGGMLPQENLKKWCNLLSFGEYNNFFIYHFFKKIVPFDTFRVYYWYPFILQFFEKDLYCIKYDIVIARLLWEIYTCMNIPMRRFKILSNFVYSGILQWQCNFIY